MYDEIFKEASEAAELAVHLASAKYNEMAGACGFAWVDVKPANSPFVNWCKKQILANGFKLSHGNYTVVKQFASKEEEGQARRRISKYGSHGVYKGWQFWNPGGYHGQRIDIKEEGAYAFATVLNKYGINAYVGSRLD